MGRSSVVDPNKKLKKGYHSHRRRESDDKNDVAIVKIVPQMSRTIRSHWILKEADGLGEIRCKDSWDQSEEYDSPSLRYVKQVSGEVKDNCWENTSQSSSSAKSPRYEIRSHEETTKRLNDSSDVPAFSMQKAGSVL